MKTILVTGAEGFFASRFIEYYKNVYNIIGLNRITLDITDELHTIEMIKKYSPTYVVHAAAISDTGRCERNTEMSFDVNVKGTMHIAKACAAAKTKLIYLSSDQVYNGNAEVGPYDEECKPVPNTVYGSHKIEAENQIIKLTDNAVILRLTWLFSLPERYKKVNSNIIWNVMRSAIKNEPIILPAYEFRGITYSYDLIENFDKLLDLPNGVYNTGSENHLSTYEVAEFVLKEMKLHHRTDEIIIKDVERYRNQNRDLRISNEKLKKYNIYFNDTEQAISKCIKDFLITI